MKIKWCQVALLVTVCILLFGIFVFYRLYAVDPPMKNTDWETVKEQLNTGDLLFINYRSKHGKLIKVFTGSVWSHVCMVIKNTNDLYFLEVADYEGLDKPEYTGLCRVSLKDFEEINEDRLMGYRKYMGEPLRSANVESILDSSIELTLSLTRLYKSLFDWNNTFEKRKQYFCSEYISLVMQQLGILDPSLDPSSYSPKKLAEIPGYDSLKIFDIN